MTVRPIRLRGPMVRAVLDGRKTQHREVLKPQPQEWVTEIGYTAFTPIGHISGRGVYIDDDGTDYGPSERHIKLPYAVGDLLWARETWNLFALSQDLECSWPVGEIPKDDPRPDAVRNHLVVDFPIAGLGGTDGGKGPWRPSTHMPRWASRLTLEVTEVRVQRIQDISEEDAVAEGLTCLSKDGGRVYKWGLADLDGLPGTEDIRWSWTMWCIGHKPALSNLWRDAYGQVTWCSNPWVAAITFVAHRRNVDELLRERAAA